MRRTIALDGFIRADAYSEEKLADFYKKAIQKYARFEIKYTKSICHVLESQEISKEDILTNPPEFKNDSLILIKNPLEYEGYHNNMGLGIGIGKRLAPQGFFRVEVYYDPFFENNKREVLNEEEDFFLEVCRFVAEELKPSLFTVTTGKGEHLDYLLQDVDRRDFSNLNFWGHTLLFIGEDFVTPDCIDDLVELETLETNRIGSGVWLRLKPISDERWKKTYDFDLSTAAGMSAHTEALAKERARLDKIINLTKGRFKQ